MRLEMPVNSALNLAHFGRWTLRDKAARRVLFPRLRTLCYMLLVFLLSTVHAALADTPGEFVGKNARGVSFILNMDGANRGSVAGSSVEIWMPSIYQYRGKRNYSKPLPSNCSLPREEFGDWEYMDCEENPSTPLSKVKYKAVPHPNRVVREMRCIEGCGPLVPKVFKYVPAESGC